MFFFFNWWQDASGIFVCFHLLRTLMLWALQFSSVNNQNLSWSDHEYSCSALQCVFPVVLCAVKESFACFTISCEDLQFCNAAVLQMLHLHEWPPFKEYCGVGFNWVEVLRWYYLAAQFRVISLLCRGRWCPAWMRGQSCLQNDLGWSCTVLQCPHLPQEQIWDWQNRRGFWPVRASGMFYNALTLPGSSTIIVRQHVVCKA